MVVANRTRLNEAMDVLKDGLIPYVETQLEAKLGEKWIEKFQSENRYVKLADDGSVHWDVQLLCKTISGGYWNTIFGDQLDRVARTYTNELLDVRNRIAHEEKFSGEDTFRALDTMQRLCELVGAGPNKELLGKAKADHQRQVYELKTRDQARTQIMQPSLEGAIPEGLKPWREVVTPHSDVATGEYQIAEFAADLAQVSKKLGSQEYLDPEEFFRRTYLTEGIKDLVRKAVLRLQDQGGAPSIELQTNFGGGKTHTLLAMYHLFSGVDVSNLPNISEFIQEENLPAPIHAKRAVLVGTDLTPGKVYEKEDGVSVRTLWGEMAYQLGGAEAYELMRDLDEKGQAPSTDDLKSLFDFVGPCLILIDEWITYASQIVERDDLSCGNFNDQHRFALVLPVAARQSPQTLVMASIPASEIELGGVNGVMALSEIKNAFGREAESWRPAEGNEGFEIVRRRLFDPIEGEEAHAYRDQAIHKFIEMYRKDSNKFPNECNDGEYAEKLRNCYPIHPELFDHLYTEWGGLERFQRTRGVLRLMATIIYCLWKTGDRSLLIMPGSLPMHDGAVRNELTHYLDNIWEPIVTRDIDGDGSIPQRVDDLEPRFGKMSAARRVTRSIFIGTAPSSGSDTAGLGIERINLSCAQPGESLPAFDDALRRIVDQATNIHSAGNRYWVSTRNNLNKTAEGKIADYLNNTEELNAEIEKRLQEESRDSFPAVQICPVDYSEIPDEPKVRLVILRPQQGHLRGRDDSDALAFVQKALEYRGSSPRTHRNCLVFMAPEKKELESLKNATARFLAWREILSQNVSLGLDAHQKQMAEDRTEEFHKTINARIQETWTQLIAPRQQEPTSAVEWEVVKAGGSDGIAKRAWNKLQRSESVLPSMGGARLKLELDRHKWFDMDAISFGELCRWFTSYLYMPRIASSKVLEDAIRSGSTTDGLAGMKEPEFATAEGVREGAEGAEKYQQLSIDGAPSNITDNTHIVRNEVAKQFIGVNSCEPSYADGSPVIRRSSQQSGEVQKSETNADGGYTYLVKFEDGSSDMVREVDLEAVSEEETVTSRPETVLKKKFTASVELSPDGIGRKVAEINDEVLIHLTSLPGASANISLDIQINVPGGIPESTERTVSENSKALKFGNVILEE